MPRPHSRSAAVGAQPDVEHQKNGVGHLDVERRRAFDRAVPGASALLESLRGVGYSPWTAIADLVDNSIAAKATRVWIDFVWRGADSYVRVVDDGRGMDQASLVSAMRPGSQSPRQLRADDDLGRFGLGLKTASLSQCRVLTVASRCVGGEVVERHWDLDHVADVDDWQLLVGRPDNIGEEAEVPRELTGGTVVLWTRLDRMVGDAAETDADARRRFFETARHVENHLAMTHHRFLAGRSPRLQIFMGRTARARVPAWDPFMAWHPATIPTPSERLAFADGHVEVQGFVLPHRDRLTPEQLEAAAGPEGWLAHQGFFVYRGDRLVVYGGWLGLGGARRWARDELHRLARVRIDLANSADDEWKIDIRKSIALPPQAIRGRLRALAERVRGESREVLAHRGGRGRQAQSEPLVRAWAAVESGGGISYHVDRTHPVVKRVFDTTGIFAGHIEEMLRVIEATVPVQRIWMDAAEHADFRTTGGGSDADPALIDALRSLYIHLVRDLALTPEQAKRRLVEIEPFNAFPAEVAALPDTEDLP